MKTIIAAVVVVSLALTAAAVRAASKPVPAPAAPGDSPLRVIGETSDTEVLYFRHDGHDCYVANARNASGISMQCLAR